MSVHSERPAAGSAQGAPDRMRTQGRAAPIALSIERGVAVATLCRPPVNAIDEAWIARLAEVLDEAERADGVAVLLIRSSERAFSAGADLALMRSRFDTAAGRAQMVAFVRELQRVYAAIERSDKVVIAEIGGPALGGGLELALACDLRIIADTAKVGLPEARLGLLPGAGGTQRLARLCGEPVAKRLILGAEVISGAEAAALGIAQWSEPAALLQCEARALAERIAALPPAALAACKQRIGAAREPGGDGYEQEIVATAALLASDEAQTRVRAFLEGRR